MLLVTLVGCLMACQNQPTSDQSTKESSEQKQALNSAKKETKTVLDSIAMAHGISKWASVKTIKYTFNVDRGNNHFERSWTWQPQTHQVSMTTKDATITYNHKKISEALKPTDQAFINDKYWLLFPFQLVWDAGLSFKDLGATKAPISEQSYRTIEVNYNASNGYTPGDTYVVYIDQNYQLKEWSYIPNGSETPSLSTTWEDDVNLGGIKMSKMHQNQDQSFQLYFTDLSID